MFLLYIFMHGFYALDEDDVAIPKRFALALHRLMIREVAEVHSPSSGANVQSLSHIFLGHSPEIISSPFDGHTASCIIRGDGASSRYN